VDGEAVVGRELAHGIPPDLGRWFGCPFIARS